MIPLFIKQYPERIAELFVFTVKLEDTTFESWFMRGAEAVTVDHVLSPLRYVEDDGVPVAERSANAIVPSFICLSPLNCVLMFSNFHKPLIHQSKLVQ